MTDAAEPPMDDLVRERIRSQYLGALEMLARAIAQCPAELWGHPGHENRFWHIAYHTLFYTHLYLEENEGSFTPWSKHRELYNFMGPLPWPPHEKPVIGDAYRREEILEYLAFCRQRVRERVPALDLRAPSGFPWLPMDKLELQLYNIRHIQHHAGQLIERLRAEAGKGVEWVSRASD